MNKEVRPNQGEVLMDWEFDEFESPNRGVVWYLAATIIGGLMLLVAIWTHNYIFGVIIILVALIYFLYDVHDAPRVGFGITTNGILIGRKFFRYKDLANFWIVYHPGEVEKLFFKPSRLTIAELSIPLEDQDPLQIRELLLQYLPENQEEDDEPLSETVGRIFKL